MTKEFREYDWADWRRLRPVTHGLKTLRYRAVDRLYRLRRARDGDVHELRRAVAGRRVLTTIAFADPEATAWQTRLVAHFLPGVLHLVADNSPSADAAAAIKQAAESSGALYLRLPANPWRQSSRSHGIAMNWVWHNVIRPGKPEAFGFLDDDIFPTEPEDPFEPLRAQDFYGDVRDQGRRWQLWAGFCTFRFASVADKPLDFGQDWFKGLDTGGGNWRSLYRYADLRRLRTASRTQVAYPPRTGREDIELQWIGTWMHEVGTKGGPEAVRDKRRLVAGLLAPHLAAAADGLSGASAHNRRR